MGCSCCRSSGNKEERLERQKTRPSFSHEAAGEGLEGQEILGFRSPPAEDRIDFCGESAEPSWNPGNNPPAWQEEPSDAHRPDLEETAAIHCGDILVFLNDGLVSVVHYGHFALAIDSVAIPEGVAVHVEDVCQSTLPCFAEEGTPASAITWAWVVVSGNQCVGEWSPEEGFKAFDSTELVEVLRAPTSLRSCFDRLVALQVLQELEDSMEKWSLGAAACSCCARPSAKWPICTTYIMLFWTRYLERCGHATLPSRCVWPLATRDAFLRMGFQSSLPPLLASGRRIWERGNSRNFRLMADACTA